MEKLRQAKKTKAKQDSHNIILILGLIYTLITILAVTSYVFKMNSISTTAVTFVAILGDVWWQLLMIILFAVCYILYNRKILFGVLLEIIMAMSMLVYITISVATMGINFLALVIELIYPFVLAIHGLSELKKLNRKSMKKRKNVRSTI